MRGILRVPHPLRWVHAPLLIRREGVRVPIVRGRDSSWPGAIQGRGTGATPVTASTVAVIGALIFGWAVLSGALARRNVTGPLVFAAAGYLLCNPDWGPVPVDIETASIHVVAEAALALVLFSDAARVNLRELRSDIGLPVRLLGIGLPLSVILGGVLAAALLLDLPWALAGFLGAALAPTDAALSVQVINDKRIPMRIRRGLNVESGLNDGIATPIVTVMLAIAASQLGIVSESPSYEAGFALRDLVVGAAVGAAIGIGGAATIAFAARRGWTASAGRRLAALALAFSAYTVAIAIHGNGFIAAFVAGIAFGATLAGEVTELDPADELPELGGELLAGGVVPLRSGPASGGPFPARCPHRGLRAAEPDRRPHDSRLLVHDPFRARPTDDHVHRLVRSSGARLSRVRAPRLRAARRELDRDQQGRGRADVHGAAEHHPARLHRRSRRTPLRPTRGGGPPE